MITYDEALKIAKAKKSNIDQVVEYANGYVFSSAADAGYKGGLGHSSIVVLKKDGEVVSMISFVSKGTGKEIGKKSV